MALLIREAEVAAALTPADALEAVREAHLALARGEAINEPRSRVRSPRMMLATMSAIDLKNGFAATKLYTATGPMVSSYVMLFEAPSGKHLATIEALRLGRKRTAAATVLAINTLAPESRRLGVIGAGYQAEGFLQALSTLSGEPPQVALWSRTGDRVDALATGFTTVSKCSSAREVCEESEVVVTLTSSAEPVVQREWLSGCRLLCGVGSNSLARREIPGNLRLRAIVVDERETAKRECGNLLPYLENGKVAWSGVFELGDLLDRSDPGLGEAPVGEVVLPTLFCSHGLAVQDLFLAACVYKRLTGK